MESLWDVAAPIREVTKLSIPLFVVVLPTSLPVTPATLLLLVVVPVWVLPDTGAEVEAAALPDTGTVVAAAPVGLG